MAVMTDPRTQEPMRPDVFWRWVWASVRPYRGQVLLVLGFIFMFVGYLGVSREVLVGRQLPYVVSGGLVGVALVSLGGRYLLIEDMRRDSGRLDRLEAAVVDLRAALLAHPNAPQLDQGHATTAVNGRSTPTVVVVSGGGSFHRPDCPIVAGKSSVTHVTPEAAGDKGLRACRMCQPLTVGA